MNCSDETTMKDAHITGELNMKFSEGGIVRKSVTFHNEDADKALELMKSQRSE